ncbi:double-stranded RNA-specific editase 1-like [Onthophagus taurus]|uniref:double-stranded RNA-specific editase 1-like n=1 Tax=Onthophagus taurus TaxID=166361 RepID=UPI0039BE6BF5
MSYNTRRNYYAGVGAIGQRRPQAMQGNFVHGGQLNANSNQQDKQFHGQQQQQKNQGNQNQKQAQQQKNNQPQKQINQQQNPVSNLTQASQQQLQQIQHEQQQLPPPPVPLKEGESEVGTLQMKEEEKSEVATSPKTASTTSESTKEKPFWIKKTIRIPRAERVRRRNMRLKKVLQPKNALMVLNELVGQTEYVVTDSKTDYNQDIFNATLSVEGQKFTGTGKSKVSAKTAAAEIAIRAIILKRLRNPVGNATANQQQSNLTQIPMEEDSEKMEEDQKEEDLSWSQIASFAIFKLLSNWDDEDGGNLVDLFSTMNSSTSDGPPTPPSTSLTNLSSEPKPAKKLPENAAHLNPSMLLNQMYPHTKYEEIGRAGNQTNVQFTISCVVDGKTFTGTGPNKKTAKKNAAFEACKALLNIEYPQEVYCQKMQVDPSPF